MDTPLPGRIYTRTDLVGHGFATSLLNDLKQPVDPSTNWGTTRTLLWGLVSFGLIPAIWWPIKFRREVLQERQVLARLADWLRAHCSHSESALLRNADEEITSRPVLVLLPLLACGAVIYFAASLYNQGRISHFTTLLWATYWQGNDRTHGTYLEKFSMTSAIT